MLAVETIKHTDYKVYRSMAAIVYVYEYSGEIIDLNKIITELPSLDAATVHFSPIKMQSRDTLHQFTCYIVNLISPVQTAYVGVLYVIDTENKTDALCNSVYVDVS
jgi:hypothetical protein